ncbi:MAG: hypothetical protein HFH82_16885 [Lachnospiraceae bacterium]|nr:hypothetical protein [Lachnospiraceae bacterium]
MKQNSQEFKESYFVANKEVGWIRGGFTITATWTWAIALLVPSQKAYEQGFAGAFWYLIPSVLTLFIYYWFLKKVDEKFLNNYTLPDLMGKRWGERIRKQYAFILAFLQVMCYAINIIAGTKLICVLLDVNYTICTMILAFIVLLYTMRGGFKSSVNTDVIQTLVLCIGSIVIIVLLCINFEGQGQTVLWAIKDGMTGFEGKAFDSLFSEEGKMVFLSYGLTSVLGLITGPFGDQMYWQRAFAIKRDKRNKAFILAAVLFTIIPVAMILTGFLASSQVKGNILQIGDSANVAIEYIAYYLPTFSTYFFVVMVAAAITSTMDSCLCAFSSVVVNDFFPNEEAKARIISYISMFGLVVTSILIANIPGIQTLYLFMFYTVIRMCTFYPTVITCLEKDKGVDANAIFYGILCSLLIATPLYAYAYYVGNDILIFIGTLLSIGFPLIFIKVKQK